MENLDMGEKIGIFIKQPQDFFLFQNLQKSLPEAEFILVPSVSFWPHILSGEYKKSDENQFALTRQFLETRNIIFKSLPLDYVSNAKNYPEFFKEFSILLDNKKSYFFIQPELSDIKKVLYFYDDVIIGYWPTIGFEEIDLVLTPGNYFNSILEPFTRAEIIGNLYLDETEKTDINTLGAFKNTKTILFEPQEELYYSMADFSGTINELSLEYNVIVSLSPETIIAKKNVNLFSLNKNIILIDENFDVRSIADSIDLAISDHALTVLGWLARGKTSIFLKKFKKDFLITKNTKNIYPITEGGGLTIATDGYELKEAVKKSLDPREVNFIQTAHFFYKSDHPAFQLAKQKIMQLQSEKRRKTSALSSLIFEPGDINMKGLNYYMMNRVNLNRLNSILYETSFFRKIIKIVKTFLIGK